jgi:hypothetical protein
MKATAAVSKRRLLKLAAFLRKLPRKRFHYDHVVGQDWKGRQDLSCGTTACAMGWAATMPIFRKLGLRMQVPEHGEFGDAVTDAAGSYVFAASEIFGISAGDADYLFSPETEHFERPKGPSPRASNTTVAAHIERYVAKYHKLAT